MSGFERGDDLESARSVADELIRLSPLSVRLHQKRVEYAVRMSDRPRLIEAYIELADALFKAGQAEKSRAVYERVIELAPDDVRAQAALDTLGETPVVPEPAPEPRKSQSGRYTAAAEVVVPPEPVAPAPEADDDFVSLGDWLRDEEAPKSTRMVVDEEAPSGDEDADFKDMLRKFKQGVAENVEEEDHESHYDLGVAFKEMGLIDEAIAEFQKALRGTAQRVRTYEALGQCFAEKGQLQVAMTILQRALGEPGAGDDQLVGVLYLLGNGAEELGRNAEAIGYYQRVFGVDITFRDVTARLQRLESAG
jgi:tetratricopeptide (TPR) repeat protein